MAAAAAEGEGRDHARTDIGSARQKACGTASAGSGPGPDARGRGRPRSGSRTRSPACTRSGSASGPVHLANELGYFREEGIEVEEILDDDMPNGIAAMERGDIDCYLRTVGEYQGLGRRKETQGTIIGTIDLSTGGDGWAADGAIKSVCDLGARPSRSSRTCRRG